MKKSITAVFAVLMICFYAVCANAAGATILYDDFESGNNIEENWEVLGNVSVEDYDGNQCAALRHSGRYAGRIGRSFSSAHATVISNEFLLSENAASRAMQIWNKSGGVRICLIQTQSNGELVARAKTNVSLGFINPGEWCRLTVLIDPENQTLEFYVNGTQRGGECSFWNDANTVGFTETQIDEQNKTMYVDNYSIAAYPTPEYAKAVIEAENLLNGTKTGYAVGESPKSNQMFLREKLSDINADTSVDMTEEEAAERIASLSQYTDAYKNHIIRAHDGSAPEINSVEIVGDPIGYLPVAGLEYKATLTAQCKDQFGENLDGSAEWKMEETEGVTIENGTLTVSEQATEGDISVTAVINDEICDRMNIHLKPGIWLYDLKLDDEGNTNLKISDPTDAMPILSVTDKSGAEVRKEILDVGEDGQIGFSALLDENLPTGVYTYTITAATANNTITFTRNHIGSDLEKIIIEAIKNTTYDKLISEVFNRESEITEEGRNLTYSEIMDIDLQGDFATVKNTLPITQSIAGKEFSSIGEMKSVFSKQLAYCLFSEAEQDTILEIVRKYKDLFGIEINDEFEKYASDIGELLIKKQGTLTDFDKINSYCADVAEIAAINRCSRDNVTEVLTGLRNKLEANGLDQNFFTSKATSEVYTEVVVKKPYTDFAEIAKLMNTKLAEIANRNQKPSGGNGSGNGGGGGGGYIPPKATEKPQQAEDDPEDPAKPIEYTDMTKEHWAYGAVEALTKKGIVNGTEEKKFLPEQQVTREEFLKMLLLAFEINTTEKNGNFKDVAEDAWFADVVNTAAKLGIVSGISEERFGVGEHITRQDMAVMIYRAAGILNRSFVTIDTKQQPTDMDTAADYAKEAIGFVYKSGIMQGLDNYEFCPKMSANRAMAAQVIYNMMEKAVQ